MRTSGAGSDYGLMLVPLGVAVFIVVMVLGGPMSFVRLLDYYVRTCLEALVTWLGV